MISLGEHDIVFSENGRKIGNTNIPRTPSQFHLVLDEIFPGRGKSISQNA